MNPNDVIDSYVEDVMRRVPAKDRDDVGLELRGLLAEMLEDKAATEGALPDDSMVLAMLRDFGTPADIAARYQPSSDFVIIPAGQSRRFAILALGGVALQWALTLPSVFNGSLHATKWWFTWGLGSLWWPGFLVTMAMIAAFVGQLRRTDVQPRASTLDSDRISRKGMAFGLVGGVLGAALMIALPWLGSSLPGPLPQVFAFDPSFLRDRAPPVLVLWLGVFATQVAVMAKGRWTPRLRALGIAFGAGFIALLCWWISDGAIVLAKPTNDGARAALVLVLAIVVIDVAVQLYRQRTRLHPR
jgi:hypothetical protein